MEKIYTGCAADSQNRFLDEQQEESHLPHSSMVVDVSRYRTSDFQPMYHLGYDHRNEAMGGRDIDTNMSPALVMSSPGKDRSPATDLRSGLPLSGVCTYQVPVTVNSDSSGDNNNFSRMWEKPMNPCSEINRNTSTISYREKWERLRNATLHKDLTMPARDHSNTMLDIDPQGCRKEMHRTPVKDRSLMLVSRSDSAIDNTEIKTPWSYPVSPAHLNILPSHSRTVGPSETPKTLCTASPAKVSTPIHDKNPANSSQLLWVGETVLTPATEQNSSDLYRRVPFCKQNGNSSHAWSDLELYGGNLPGGSGACQKRSHNERYCGMRYARDSGLVSNVLLGILCLIVSAFGLVLLFRLKDHASEGMQVQSGDSLLTSNSSYTILKDIAVGLSALVVFLNLWCLLTLALTSYLAARLLKCQHGDQRASEFIRQCEVTRVASAAGSFVSIPVFMLALLLYTVIDYSFISAIICVVIFSCSTICTIITIIHSTCTWHQQKSMTILQQDPVASSEDVRNVSGPVQNPTVNFCELSTLV